MGLPVIDSYPMPDRSAVPPSCVPWLIDPARAALLVHDMQNHFVRAFPAGRSPVVELVANVAALRELAGTLGIPVIFTAEPAAQRRDQRGLLVDVWGPGIGDESDAGAIVAALTPRPLANTCWPTCATTPFSAVIWAGCCDPRAATN